jgi:hypothetical protein
LQRRAGTNSHCKDSLIRLDSEGPGWLPDFEGLGDVQQQQQQQGQQQHVEQQPELLQGQCTGAGIGRPDDGVASSSSAAAAAAVDELEPGAGFECTASSTHAQHVGTAAADHAGSSSDGEQQQQQLPDDFDYSGEVPDFDHSQKRQELIIYAIPLTRGKVRSKFHAFSILSNAPNFAGKQMSSMHACSKSGSSKCLCTQPQICLTITDLSYNCRVLLCLLSCTRR